MKNIFIAILLMLLGSSAGYAVSPAILHGISGGGCSESYFSDVTPDTAWSVGQSADRHYVGTVYTPAADECVCAIDVYVYGIQGTLTTDHDYYAQIYEMTTTTLSSLVTNGTSNVVAGETLAASTWVSANAGKFEFSTCVSLTGSTAYAIVFALDTEGDGIADEPNLDGTNYWQLGHDDESNIDSVLGGTGKWTWDSSIPYAQIIADEQDDIQIKVWTE